MHTQTQTHKHKCKHYTSPRTSYTHHRSCIMHTICRSMRQQNISTASESESILFAGARDNQTTVHASESESESIIFVGQGARDNKTSVHASESEFESIIFVGQGARDNKTSVHATESESESDNCRCSNVISYFCGDSDSGILSKSSPLTDACDCMIDMCGSCMHALQQGCCQMLLPCILIC
jgi:hypothetical protein